MIFILSLKMMARLFISRLTFTEPDLPGRTEYAPLPASHSFSYASGLHARLSIGRSSPSFSNPMEHRS